MNPFQIPIRIHDPFSISVEIIYLAIIVIACLLIYFKTREIYELSKHKGIKYFRYSFLFFALAFLFRFIFLMFRFLTLSADNHLPRGFMMSGLWLGAYFSTLAILYLMFSILWKLLGKDIKWSIFIHMTALMIGLWIFLTHSPGILLITQIILIFGTAILVFVKRKGITKLSIIYSSFLLVWITNLVLLVVPRFALTIRIVLYLVQIILFLIILRKVIRITK